MKRVDHVTVLGAGVMGAQIAAHFANAGVPVLLLDITPDVAKQGLERARKLSPNPFFTADTHRLVTTGGFEDSLARAAASDWIIEAVVERLDVKQALFEKVERARRPDAVVSSNTSGIPLHALAEGRSEGFRRHFLGTHFFNPPRYLRLLEVIPTPETDPAVTAAVSTFAERRLGKGVVLAKDAPNFIANHIAMHGLMKIFELVASGRYTIEEVEAITGPAIGRPKSATFRTVDLAGLDVLAHVMRNQPSPASVAPGVAQGFSPATPPSVAQGFSPDTPEPVKNLLTRMLDRGLIGEKAGQGFFKKVRNPDGSTEILVLDLQTFEYRPQLRPRFPSIETAKSIEDTRERLKVLFNGSDRVGEFLRATLGESLAYTARVWAEIANDPADIDRAMRWGFGWELGPFETMRVLGLGKGDSHRFPMDLPETVTVPSWLRRGKAVKRNAGASLVDVGDDVLAIEFHSKMNAIGGDTIAMIDAGFKEAARNFRAVVVGNDATNFSAGANLMLLLLEAQEGNWDEVDLMIRAFQRATMALRTSPVPVVVAPAGLTLGGGCEMCLHGDRVQAAAESYIGLVEVGVGLIPAGGGTKEMLARAMDNAGQTSNLLAVVQPVFETIAFGKVSTSGPEARQYGYLRDVDGITMNRDLLLEDAKRVALERATMGYAAPQPRAEIRVGGADVLAALRLGVHLAWRAGRISDHDKLVGHKLAWVLAGGSLPHASTVTEQQLLDLEREAFLSLCGERKTLERIAHTLKTGKTLRN